MENAADALKMAGAVLIFVLAISIIILSFGQVRESVDIIVDYRDRETTYINGDYYYKGTEQLERSVNLETIIPSIFRAYLENYKIVFDGLGSPIYKITNKNNGKLVGKYTLDLETNQDKIYNNVTLANNDTKAEFLRGIIYRDFDNGESAFETKFNISLDGCESIYDQLTKEEVDNIIEYLGVYYQNDDPNVPDVNKTEKRIITYKIND